MTEDYTYTSTCSSSTTHLFKWNIENFVLRCTSSKDGPTRPPTVSEPLTVHDTTWRVILEENSEKDGFGYRYRERHYNIKLMLLTAPSRWVTYQISLLPEEKTIEEPSRGPTYFGYIFGSERSRAERVAIYKKKSDKAELIHPNQEFGFRHFTTCSEILKYLKPPHDTLTVQCEINALMDDESELKKKVEVPNCDLGLNLKLIYEGKLFCDASLQVGNSTFEVHKAILSARSHTFKSIFENSSETDRHKTTKKIVVTIDNIEPNVVEEMLAYIYNGEAPTNIKQQDMAKKLLHAADIYQLDRLKAMCEDVLSHTLKVDNAIKLLDIANCNSAHQLKQICLQEISSNWPQFKTTPDWQEMTKERTALAAEVMEYIASNPPPAKKSKTVENELHSEDSLDYVVWPNNYST